MARAAAEAPPRGAWLLVLVLLSEHERLSNERDLEEVSEKKNKLKTPLKKNKNTKEGRREDAEKK